MIILATLIAALPPFAQTNKELQAILNSKELYQYVTVNDCFKSIQKTENGYLIITEKERVIITIRYGRSHNIMGPIPFTLEFSLDGS